jgi:hypothetical protein
MARRSSGLEKAARALATADGIAHVVYVGLFTWRIFSGSLVGKLLSVAFVLLAMLGLGLGIVGSMLVKHGGPTRARTLGLYAVALSTGLAGFLLLVASWGG